MIQQQPLRGKPRSEIQKQAKRQKFMFVAAMLQEADTLTAAAKAAGVFPQQARRWRRQDPAFDRAVSQTETLIVGEYTEEEYQEMVAGVRAYLVGIKRELKEPGKELGK